MLSASRPAPVSRSRLNPLVSIVIPAYNAGPYLAEAIDSVLQQSYPNIEMIVLDDGSTDNTSEIIAGYSKDAFFRERHPNMGQAATLNKGWNLARGEIFSYLSADDALLPEAVAEATVALSGHDDAIMAYGDYELMDDQSRLIRRIDAPDFSYRQMLCNIVVQPGPGVFFRKSGFERIGGWKTCLRQIPDYEYWLRLGLLGPFLHVRTCLARFRVHQGSQSFRASDVDKSDEIIRVMERFFDSPCLPTELAKHRKASLAMANVVAARLHMRARRTTMSWSRLQSAMQYQRCILLRPRALRLMGNALIHSLRNQLT